MKLKITPSDKWHGPIRFLMRPSDAADGLPKGLTLPSAVGSAVTVAPSGKGETRVFVSLGEKEKIEIDGVRKAGGAVAGWMRANKAAKAGVEVFSNKSVAKTDSAVALAEGLLLGAFEFKQHKTENEKSPSPAVDILTSGSVTSLKKRLDEVERICGGTITARELAHEPPNVINPVTLARRVRMIASKSGLKCTVLDEKQMANLKMGGILAVGRGSATPPRLIVLEYNVKPGSKTKPVILVGKAITFDTGGYSIKPQASILGMKYDKCGGMTVVGAMQALAACKAKTPVVGLIAAAENMIAGNAYRPDDIITTMSGKTVEIVSADAEGRMVLCDALTYAQKKYKPRCMIDLATLTGGVVVALGSAAAGVFSNDESLQDALVASGRKVHERLWPLPLWDEYFELLKGDDGDFKNSGAREAHPIQGAIFLKQFVDAQVPWAHLDIAGVATASKDNAYCPKGATGFGVRLLADYILGL